MYKIDVTAREFCPYRQPIMNMLETLYPNSTLGGAESILEALTGILVGSKQLRNGPTPDPERLVSIRSVVRASIERNDPIPMLIAWGGSKQGQFEVDLAELMALTQLAKLQENVKEYYSPGMDMVIRLENLTDYILFGDRYPAWRGKTDLYCGSMIDLAHMVLPEAHITGESEFTTEMALRLYVHSDMPEILKAIQTDDIQSRGYILADIGWNGNMPHAQIDYYRRSYDRLYPDMSYGEKDDMIATYFAISLARAKANATGASRFSAYSTSPLLAGFSGPIPGASQEKRLYYRTVPCRFTNTTRAPWLSKGYIRIVGREASPALASWDGSEYDHYSPNHIIIDNGVRSITIQADYQVID